VVAGKHIDADIGGQLAIESPQNKTHYDIAQQSLGGTLSVGAGLMGGSANYAKSKVNSDFLSVGEQSGLLAGDSGFNIKVAGNTTLTGGVITSTDKAIQGQKNQFETGGSLRMSDLHNHAEYDASSVSVNVGTSMSPSGALSPLGSGAGVGNESGQADSDTRSGISGIAGNQNARTGDAQTGLKPIFDADKVQKEINAQTQITQVFGQQAGQAVSSYVERSRAALLDQKKKARTDAERKELQGKLDDLTQEERVMNILIGAVTGQGATAVTKEGLSLAADKMRQLMIEDSQKFKGIIDTDGTVYTNLSTKTKDGKPLTHSDGVRGDGEKLGGTRWDLDQLCGTDYQRCKTVAGKDGLKQLDLKDGMVQFNRDGADGKSLPDFLKTDDDIKLSGATGGIQGVAGTFFGKPYVAGSWQDHLVEAFAGTHDMVGGKLSGLYDKQGNAKRGRSEAVKTAQDIWSATGAIAASTPFAMSEYLSPQVWNAISLFIKAAK